VPPNKALENAFFDLRKYMTVSEPQHAMLSDYFFVLIFAMTVLEPQHAILLPLKQRDIFIKLYSDFIKQCLALLSLCFW
jgi:hypothetical protein